MEKYSVKLSLSELKLLDGRVSKEAQEVVDTAKKEAGYGFELPVMNRILREAEERGELTWTWKEIRSCPYCDKHYTYHPYVTNGKYARKGEPNYSRPKYYRGVQFNVGFISFQGHGDMCIDCLKEKRVLERLIDYILDHDLEIEIQQEMRASEMGKKPAMFGSGSYPAICPHCGAESMLFRGHKTTDKWVMMFNDTL